MGTVISVVLIIAMIGAGIALVHRLNAQHGARIAAFRYSEPLPGIGRSRGRNRRPAGPGPAEPGPGPAGPGPAGPPPADDRGQGVGGRG
ncbi:hypothetical protein ABZ498_07225 [Streptomyces lavendulocolor]|uniref:hypothetical protein n=1 Tax=Streptomyces lavendulocolor TaxID=67316 RepID=UPI0033E54630